MDDEGARELAMRGEQGCALRTMGEIATAQGQFDKAAKYLKESLSILEEVGDAYESARAQLSLARVYVSQQELGKSSAALDLCIQVFEGLGATLDLTAARTLQKDITTE